MTLLRSPDVEWTLDKIYYVPVDTCVRLLQSLSWSFAGMEVRRVKSCVSKIWNRVSVPVTINQGSSVIKGRGEIGPLCPLLPVSGSSIVFIKGTYARHPKSKQQFVFKHQVSGSVGVKKAPITKDDLKAPPPAATLSY